MSLHSVLKDTWYMRLKDKREQRTIEPSRFALGIPAMDKRNDALGSKAHVQAGVNTRDLDLVSMTNGDYINSRIGGHSSTFSREQLNKILHASPSSPGETYGADEPPVELDAPVVGGVEGGGNPPPPPGGGAGSAQKKNDSSSTEAVDRMKASQAPVGTPVSNPAVYKPVAEVYKSSGSGVTLQPTRNGAELLVAGVNIANVANLTSAPASLSADLEKAKEALMGIKAGLEAGSAKKRVESDLAKLKVALAKLVAIKKGNDTRKEVGKLKEAKYEAEIEGINTGVTKIQALVRGALVRKSAKAKDTAEKAMAGILEEVRSKVDKEKALAEIVAEMERQGASKAKIAKITKAVTALQKRFRNRMAVPENTIVTTAEEEGEEGGEEEEDEEGGGEVPEAEDANASDDFKKLMTYPDLTEAQFMNKTQGMRRVAKMLGIPTTQKREGRNDYEKRTMASLATDIRNNIAYVFGGEGQTAITEAQRLNFNTRRSRLYTFMVHNNLFNDPRHGMVGQPMGRPGRGRRGGRGGGAMRGGAMGGGGGNQ